VGSAVRCMLAGHDVLSGWVDVTNGN
jgi:hypothetical protein